MKLPALAQVSLALILAVIAGIISGSDRQIAMLDISYLQLYDLIGRLFLNALTLVVVPLVASSIISGAARIGAEDSLGSLGKKTAGYFALTSTLAALVGYGIAIVIAPGVGLSLESFPGETPQLLEKISDATAFLKIEQIVLKIIPSNIIAAASQGQMLGLILFCLLFGYYAAKIDESYSATIISFWKGLFQIMMRMTFLIMKALPIGVFALVAKVVAQSGIDAFYSVANLLFATTAALAIYGFLLLPLLLRFFAKVNPWPYFRVIAPALMTAFSTSSSVAALPMAIDCLERRGGLSNRVCSFVLPLGSSTNLPGTVLYVCVVIFFIAQAYGVELSAVSQVTVVALSMLTALGMAGIPSASLIAIMVILQVVELPSEGVGLIFAVERILDMFRTTISVLANSCCAVAVARAEGELAAIKE